MHNPTPTMSQPAALTNSTPIQAQAGRLKDLSGRSDIPTRPVKSVPKFGGARYFTPNLAYLEDSTIIKVVSISEKKRLLQEVGSTGENYGTFDLAFMREDHPVGAMGTLGV